MDSAGVDSRMATENAAMKCDPDTPPLPLASVPQEIASWKIDPDAPVIPMDSVPLAFSSTKSDSDEAKTSVEPVPLHFASASECGVEDQDVLTTFARIKAHKFLGLNSNFPPVRAVALCIVQMANQQRSIKLREKQVIFNILKSFNSINTFTAEMERSLSIRTILNGILGDVSMEVDHFEFPGPFQRNALILLQRLDTEIILEEIPKSEASPNPEVDSNGKKKRKRKSDNKSASPIMPLSRTPEDKETFRNIMRGIKIYKQSGQRSYRLDETFQTRDCKVFGHNGLRIGDWWPFRICALRDGAHGAMQGGIAGSINTGAYSIVVSNQYATLDRDLGSTLYYSGSNSHNNTDPHTPHISNNTKALRASLSRRHPVRVLRSGAGTENKYAPSKGIRYDGLYEILSEALEKNAKGGAYVRFELARKSDQENIDSTRPNWKEREVMEELDKGVGW